MASPPDPAPSTACAAPPAAEPQRAAEALRLLLIEDSAFDARMIGRLLGQSGFRVEELRVEDEPGLRAALAAGPWDAIISDHNLPDFSATDALRIYKASGLDAPFIIVSGQIGEEIAVEAMLAGADDYVLKSNLSRLSPALRRGLRAADSRRLQRETEQALAASEVRLQGITANLPGMVFQLEQAVGEAQWRFRYASEGVQLLLGIAADALIADPAVFLDRIDSSDRLRIEELLAQGARDMANVRWDGRVTPLAGTRAAWVALTCKPRLANSSALIWEGVMIDITAQKLAEESLARSREDLRELTAHFETVREDERKAIAREVHDDIGGILTSLKFELAACRGAPELSEEQRSGIDSMSALVESARLASDRIMRNLRPSILDQGIVAALEWLALQFSKTYGIACAFSANQDAVALPENRRTAMFRICQEALTNIAKHAGANRVQIELFAQSRAVSLEICDNGKGVLAANLAGSERFGIRGMRERAAALGGWVEIHGSPSAGTTVMLSLPLTGTAQA